ERIRREVPESDSWCAFMFRSHVVSRISADHERLADGAVLQQFRNPVSGPEGVPSSKRRACEAARPADRRARRTASPISPGENQKRGSCQTNCRTRSHRGGTDLYLFRIGALPDLFVP